MIKYTLALVLSLYGCTLWSQQAPAWSSFYETGFAWNPALTARWSRAETAATYKKEWTNFEGAPEQANLSYQLPLIAKFTKASVGFMADYDKVGPFRTIGGKVTGTYRIHTGLFGNRRDVMSFGLGFGAQRYTFDPTRLVAFDGKAGDLSIIPIQTWLNPEVSAGAYYCSTSDLYEFESHYYFGAAIQRLVPITRELLPNANYRGTTPVNLHGGYRYYPFRASYFIEPSAFIAYAPAYASNVMAACRVENAYLGWLAGGIVSNGEIFLQGGLIFTSEGSLGNIIRDGALRVGVKIDRQTINLGRYAGLGFELYTAYTFDMDNYKK